MVNIESREASTYLIFFFFSSCHFFIHSFICFACCPCHVVTDTPKEPKNAVVYVEPITPIPAYPGNSLSFPSLCVPSLLILCPLILFISLPKAYTMLVLRFLAYWGNFECYVWGWEQFYYCSLPRERGHFLLYSLWVGGNEWSWFNRLLGTRPPYMDFHGYWVPNNCVRYLEAVYRSHGNFMQRFPLSRSAREHFLKLLGCVMNEIKHNFVDTVSVKRIL